MKDKPEKLYTLQLTKSEIRVIAASMSIAAYGVFSETQTNKDMITIANAGMVLIASVKDAISLVEKFKSALGEDA